MMKLKILIEAFVMMRSTTDAVITLLIFHYCGLGLFRNLTRLSFHQ